MPFVVTENCIKCKHTDCVEVCPVDCFHEGPNFLVIDPDECIDCTLCEPECPVNAIYPEEDVPAARKNSLRSNAELAKEWPVLATRKDPPPDAAEWDGKPEQVAAAGTLIASTNKTTAPFGAVVVSSQVPSELRLQSAGEESSSSSNVPK